VTFTVIQLVTAGQQSQAVDVLRRIRDHNGSAFAIELSDVHDRSTHIKSARSGIRQYHPVAADELGNNVEVQDLELNALKSSIKFRTSVRETIQDYVDRLSDLLQSDLRRVTLLMWALWFTASAAYT
jgi:hypothetical protein